MANIATWKDWLCHLAALREDDHPLHFYQGINIQPNLISGYCIFVTTCSPSLPVLFELMEVSRSFVYDDALNWGNFDSPTDYKALMIANHRKRILPIDRTPGRMPLSELETKWEGMTFEIAAEEMRHLKEVPSDREKLVLYSLYKQAIHGDIPPIDIYPRPADEQALKKYEAWSLQKGKSSDICRSEYVKYSEEMIRKYKRNIIRTKWNSQVWSVDY